MLLGAYTLHLGETERSTLRSPSIVYYDLFLLPLRKLEGLTAADPGEGKRR